MCGRDWSPGELFEALVYDQAKKEQGKALWEVVSSEERNSDGLWMSAKMLAMEDRDLRWRVPKGGGGRYNRRFRVHLCAGAFARCKCYDGKVDGEFHSDHVRQIDKDDIRTRRVAWWLAGTGKSDFEEFRKKCFGGQPRGGGQNLNEDDVLGLDVTDDEFPPEGEKETPPPSSLKRDLQKLKEQTGKGGDTQKRRREPKKPVGGEKASSSKQKAREDASEEGTPGTVVQGWFGGKLTEGGQKTKKKRKVTIEPSEEEEEEKPKKKRKAPSSKHADRGPYGIGEAVHYEAEGSGTDTDGEEQVFRGGVPERRSQQLKLVEYAQQKPGRLTSRLLLKMQSMLSRESGTPFHKNGAGLATGIQGIYNWNSIFVVNLFSESHRKTDDCVMSIIFQWKPGRFNGRFTTSWIFQKHHHPTDITDIYSI